MIEGIVAQSRVLRRGALYSRAYLDDDGFLAAVVSRDIDTILFAGFVTDSDVVYHPSASWAIVSALSNTFVGEEVIYAPAIRKDQVLIAGLYADADSIRLPDIRIPGVLQPGVGVGVEVDDVVYIPAVVTPGTLRPGLVVDFDTFYGGLIEAPETLRPTSRYVDTDVVYASIARISLGSPAFVDSDAIYGPTLPIVMLAVASDDQFYTPAIGFLATLDGDAINTSLSVDKLTATHTAAISDSGARSTSLRSSGKFYFEATIGATHGQADAVGLLTMNGTFADSPQARNVTADYSTTTIWSDNTSWGNLGTWVAGDHIGVAINLDNRKGWFRRNNGNWNNSTTDDPVANTGGVTIAPNVPFSPFVGFGGSTVGQAGDNISINFGQSPFSMAQPSGFKLWPAISEVKQVVPQLVTDDTEAFPSTGIGNFFQTMIPDLYADDEVPYAASIGRFFQTLTPQVLVDDDVIYPPSTPRQWILSASWAGTGSVIVQPSEGKTQIVSNVGAVK